MDTYEVEVWTDFTDVELKQCENLIEVLTHSVPDTVARDGLGLPYFRIDDNYEYDEETFLASGRIGVLVGVIGHLDAREVRAELEDTFHAFEFVPKSCIIG